MVPRIAVVAIVSFVMSWTPHSAGFTQVPAIPCPASVRPREKSSSHSSLACMATNRRNEGQAWKIDILPRLPLPSSSVQYEKWPCGIGEWDSVPVRTVAVATAPALICGYLAAVRFTALALGADPTCVDPMNVTILSLTLPWMGEVPVCLWNVSHIGMFALLVGLIPFKDKGANHILAFCAGLSWFVVEVPKSRTFEHRKRNRVPCIV